MMKISWLYVMLKMPVPEKGIEQAAQPVANADEVQFPRAHK